MRRSTILGVCVVLLVGLASCVSPTGDDIEESLKETL